MRYGAWAAIAAAVTTAVAASALTPATDAAATSTSTVDITYRGTTISVPRGWPVYDLSKDPTRCVRLDRHAVYLGTPGPDQACPAHLVGRTEAIIIQPYSGAAVPAEEGTVQGVVRGASGSVLVSTSYGATGAGAADRLIPAHASTPLRPLAAALPATPLPAAARTIVRTVGFDTCAAPSAAALHRWRGISPFRAVGIYIGGVNRACGYGNLSAAWVRTVRSYGYRFIPTYVGRQAPCTGIGATITPSQATAQGLNAARDALSDMARLGFRRGSPIYLDMEHYGGTPSCRLAVLRFVSAWVYRLHLSGFLAGLYTSSWTSIVKHHTDGFRNPDVVWIGRWNSNTSVFGDPVVPNYFWKSHQRIHQYRGGHTVRYNGVALNLDSDVLDAPVG